MFTVYYSNDLNALASMLIQHQKISPNPDPFAEETILVQSIGMAQWLQMEIADMENKLSATRRFFNSTTKELNTAIQSFPANLIAGMFGFTVQPMFEIPVEQQAAMEKAPEIKF